MPSPRAIDADFRKKLEGHSLITAEILYRLPDHPSILQSFVWQEYDIVPQFPILKRFLEFWRQKLDGPLHSVRIAHCRLIRPAEIALIDAEYKLH